VHLSGGHFPLAPFFILVWMVVLFALIGSRMTKKAPIFTGIELLDHLGHHGGGLAAWATPDWCAPSLSTSPRPIISPPTATAGPRLQPLLPEGLYPAKATRPRPWRPCTTAWRAAGTWVFFELLAHIPWDAWITPLLAWGGFILLAYFVMLCLVNLFSRQWVVNERVNFPLLRVPQLMAQAFDEQWLGRLFPKPLLPLRADHGTVCLHLMNGLSFYFPEMPPIPTLILAGSYFGKHGCSPAFTS
jgi:hypothetical protein